MADILEEIAQLEMPATTLSAIYTVPASTSIMASVTVCNRTSGNLSWRLSIAIAGAADDPKQYKFYDVNLAGNDSVKVGPYGMKAADVLRGYASATGLTFSVNGIRVTQ